MKQHTAILVVAVAACVTGNQTITRCDGQQFQTYLQHRDDAHISICMRDRAVRSSLCNTTIISGTILELSLPLLERWQQACLSFGPPTPPAPHTTSQDNFATQLPLTGQRTNTAANGTTSPPQPFSAQVKPMSAFASSKLQELILPAQPAGASVGGHAGSRVHVLGETAKYTTLIAEDLARDCPRNVVTLDKCFRKGFINARKLFKKKDPLIIPMSLKSGSSNIKWRVHWVKVYGISNYTVQSVSARPSTGRRRTPLKIVTQWFTDRWRLELNMTYYFAVVPGSLSLTKFVILSVEMPSVEIQISSQIWGQENKNQGFVRFYSEDRIFNVKFNPADVKVHVNRVGDTFPAMDELISMHVLSGAWKTLWPIIKARLAETFQKIANGQVIPVVIEFVLRRNFATSRGSPVKPPPVSDAKPPPLPKRLTQNDGA